MIVDASNYRWRSRPFRLWLYDHGVTLDDVFRIDIDEFTQVITIYKFVQSNKNLPLTNYATIKAAANIQKIKMLRYRRVHCPRWLSLASFVRSDFSPSSNM